MGSGLSRVSPASEGYRSPGLEFDGGGDMIRAADVFWVVADEIYPVEFTWNPYGEPTAEQAQKAVLTPRPSDAVVQSVDSVPWSPSIASAYNYPLGFPHSGSHIYGIGNRAGEPFPVYGEFFGAPAGEGALYNFWPDATGFKALLIKLGISETTYFGASPPSRFAVANYWLFAPWFLHPNSPFGKAPNYYHRTANRIECAKMRVRANWGAPGWIARAGITITTRIEPHPYFPEETITWKDYALKDARFVRNTALQAFSGSVARDLAHPGSFDTSGPWFDLEMPGGGMPDKDGEHAGEIIFAVFGETRPAFTARTGWQITEENP